MNEPDYPYSTADPHLTAQSTSINDATPYRKVQPSITTKEIAPDLGSRNLWTSFWLQKKTLFGFFALFTSCWVSLIILMHYNIRENGFSLVLTSNHYTWTYGPTAILTIIVCLWRQVDYWCKLSQPWSEMKRGPAVSSKTVLLDYISPLQITSLWRALKNKHGAIVASILGFTILKAIIVISTTFLIPSTTTLSGTFPITITAKFDGTPYLETLPASWNYSNIDGSTPTTSTYTNISDAPVRAYQAILEGGQNPIEILDGAVVEDFNLTSTTTQKVTRVEGLTRKFVPEISCEVANITNTSYITYQDGRVGSFLPDNPFIGFTLDAPACSVANQTTPLARCPDDGGSCQQYIMLGLNCSGNTTSNSISINSETTHDLRLALIAFNFTRINQTFQTWNVSRTTAALCKIDYSIQDANLTKDLENDSLILGSPPDSNERYRIPNMNGIQLGEILRAMLANKALVSEAGENTHPIFNLMKSTLNDTSVGFDYFFSEVSMVKSFVTTFGELACHFIQMNFLSPDQASAQGIGFHTEERLHIQTLPTGLMIAGLVIISFISLGLIYIAPREASSQAPTLLASYGIVLATSPSMQALLKGTGELRTSELTQWLQDYVFHATIANNGAFRIQAFNRPSSSHLTSDTPNSEEGGMQPSHTLESVRIKKGTWVPLFARYPMVILTLILPIFAIVCVEILYRVSEKNGGILDSNNTPTYYVRYPSTAAVLIIATMFNSLDFTVTSFAPFHALRSKAVSANQSILTNLVQMMPPFAMYNALISRFWGAFLSNWAGLIGSTLTIVVSGLWVIDSSVPKSAGLTAYSANTWNLSWSNSTYDGGTAQRLIKSYPNYSSSPEGTWEDLVFPDIANLAALETELNSSPINISDQTAQANLQYSMIVPVLRPKLSCQPVTDLQIRFASKDNTSVEVIARYPLPQHCHGGPGGNRTYGKIDSFAVSSDKSWLGDIYDLHMGPWDESNSGYVESSDPSTYVPDPPQPVNPAGCPGLAVLYGRFDWNNTQKIKDEVTGLFCYHQIEQVQANVSFSLNGTGSQSVVRFGQNLLSPPSIDESTAVTLTNGTKGFDSFPFAFQDDFGAWDCQSFLNSSMWFFGLMTPIACGGSGIPSLQSMVGPNNTELLADTVNKMYKMYMTRVITSSIFRTPMNESLSPSPQKFTGTVSTMVSRLRVDYKSKLVLQILLAVMTVLGGLGFFLTNIRGTLPRNPFSIASLMSLFASSEFCNRKYLPEYAEWMTKRELKSLLGTWKLGLGWWDEQGSEREDGNARQRFGIDIGIPEIRGFARKQGKGE